MSSFADRSCGCPPVGHPAPPDVPAGLDHLVVRQAAGFPEYRAAMLTAILDHPPLAGWRARGEGDLGVMLLEAWAYVLDVIGFYDARVAERAYIQTARDVAAANALAALLGHRLRGAMAARVTVALEADGADRVPLRRGVAFRSEAFGTEPPQIFELDSDVTVWPQRNRWRLAPVRAGTFDGTLRFLSRGAPPAGAVVVVASGSTGVAARIATVEPETGQDGARYLRAVLDGGKSLDALSGAALEDLELMVLRLPLAPNPFATSTAAVRKGTTALTLDAVYPQVRAGDWAALDVGGALRAVRIDDVSVTMVTVDDDSGAKQAATRVTFDAPASFSVAVRSSTSAAVLHAAPFRLSSPVRPAKTVIGSEDVRGGADLLAPVAPLAGAPDGGDVLLVGTRAEGALVGASIVELGNGAARLNPTQGSDLVDGLTAPVDVFGNVATAIRGETVIDEALGSAEASTPFNRFTLRKKPLVWRSDASQPDGRRPDLTVRVGGLTWTRADTFFGRGPTEEIYVVRQEPDGTSSISFGDGTRGARPPTGVDNVRADYRFGAGAAAPPAGAVDQLVRRIKGLAGVRGPLAATGGADMESAADLRTAAPARALTLGRAVSLLDFEAHARNFAGVVNVQAGWIWDERRQRAAVKLWVVRRGGAVDDLAPYLSGQSVPDLVIVVAPAQRAPFDGLSIGLEVAPRHDPVEVRAGVVAALFDDACGLLSPARQTIGAPLFRSALTLAIHRVDGVASVRSILLDGVAMPAGVAPGMGRWFDLAAGTTVA